MAPVWEHAFGKKLTPFNDRVHMCKLAIKDLGQGFKVSNIERQTQSQGKSLLTLRALSQKYPLFNFKLLMGSDTWKQRKLWYQFPTLQKEFGALVIPRGAAGDTKALAIPDISSSYIRSHTTSNKTKAWMNPHVLAYYLKLPNK